MTKGQDKFVQFVKSRSIGDKIVIETYAPYTTKNDNGYYEIPDNLERNGLNSAVETLTLGEINNHVLSITKELEGFTGTQPGSTNLKEIGSALPLQGGVAVAKYNDFRPNTTIVPYGTEYRTTQEVTTP